MIVCVNVGSPTVTNNTGRDVDSKGVCICGGMWYVENLVYLLINFVVNLKLKSCGVAYKNIVYWPPNTHP